MSEKQYQVAVEQDHVADVDAELRRSSGSSTIPNRSVDVADARTNSKRITHYALTAEEAEKLRQDPRVKGVELTKEEREAVPLEQRGDHRDTNIFDTLDYDLGQGNFDKTVDSGTDLNWGFMRHTRRLDPWNGAGGTVTTNHRSAIDGTGVDIVISDDGSETGHPEWLSEDGSTSRFQQIDWYAGAGVSGTMPTNFYDVTSGHGAHVMGTAGGLYHGWAKGAHLYSMKTLDSGAISPSASTSSFDLIRLWHRNKPVDPETGFKRPTVVNASWGSLFGMGQSNTAWNLNYRGTNYTNQTVGSNIYGFVGRYRSDFGQFVHPYSNPIYETEIEDMLDEGVHFVTSAGNYQSYIAAIGDQDYNNQTTSPYSYFYHRGGLGGTLSNAITVGNINNNNGGGGASATEETKADSSECGPGVTIWAAGTNIISAGFQEASFGNTYTYGYSGNSGNTYGSLVISGTSMASPQVCGALACYLQTNPGATPQQGREWLEEQATRGLLYYTSQTDYRNSYNCADPDRRILYIPYWNKHIRRLNNKEAFTKSTVKMTGVGLKFKKN